MSLFVPCDVLFLGFFVLFSWIWPASAVVLLPESITEKLEHHSGNTSCHFKHQPCVFFSKEVLKVPSSEPQMPLNAATAV